MLLEMLRRPLAALSILLAVAACATPPSDPEERAEWEQVNDPLEPTNRAIFEFNLTLDRYIMKPVATAYRDYLPEPVRRSVHNFLNNLNSPLIFANDLLQGQGQRAMVTFSRAVINTTAGIGGLLDVASDYDLPRHDEDAGQTFAVWGVSDGPFLMLPLFGPSNPRDTAGMAVEFVADPLSIYLKNIDLAWVGLIRGGMQAIDTRVEFLDSLDAIERTSLDFYSTMRSISRQYRQDQIRNSAPVDQGYGTLAPQPR
jgi:phospholipid-binding lipoprotein MlaA